MARSRTSGEYMADFFFGVSSLHPLKSWSLGESRGGSIFSKRKFEHKPVYPWAGLITTQENGPFPVGTSRDMDWGRQRRVFQALASRPAPRSEVMAGLSGWGLPSVA